MCTCRKAGIKCAIINGISKGFGYGVGDEEVGHLRDRWTAVYVDGWRLIHPLWAFKNIISYKEGKWVPKSHLQGGRLKLDEITDDNSTMTVDHDFNEYYFMVEPDEMLSVCFPDKPEWQLITPPIDRDTWTKMPLFMKRFHMEGFKMATEFKSTLESKDGVSGMVIRSPRKKDAEYQLAHDLFFNFSGDEKAVHEEAIFLKNYVMCARDCKDDKWIFEARMPVAGTYRITVYGGPCDRKQLPWICDVAIKCEESMKKLKPYPDCPAIGFGPVGITEIYGLTSPSHPNGMLFVKPRQTYHITFTLIKTIKTKAKMVGKHVDGSEMEKWIKCTTNNQSTTRILDLSVNLLREGEYALKVFGKSREVSGSGRWENIVNYYLSTDPPREHGQLVKDKGYKVRCRHEAWCICLLTRRHTRIFFDCNL